MKLEYLDEAQQVLFTEMDPVAVPRVGDIVWFDEILYVENVVWYPTQEDVRVYLTMDDPAPKRKKVAESKESPVKLDQVLKAQNTADKALKEADRLNKEIFSIRQYLRNQSDT